MKIGVFVIDVDGCMTDGSYWYSSSGKLLKRFGPDDADALKLIADHVHIAFVSADRKGWRITERRIVRDMGYPLYEVSPTERVRFIAERFGVGTTAYMGDSFQDAPTLRRVVFGIAPANAAEQAKAAADFVCERRGGDRAVTEAVFKIMEVVQ